MGRGFKGMPVIRCSAELNDSRSKPSVTDAGREVSPRTVKHQARRCDLARWGYTAPHIRASSGLPTGIVDNFPDFLEVLSAVLLDQCGSKWDEMGRCGKARDFN